MTKKRRVGRIVLLVGALGASLVMQAALVPTPGFGADRHADQPQGIPVLTDDDPGDEGPPPCTVSSPCERWVSEEFLSA